MQYIEFPYLEELNESEYLNLKVKEHWVVCDSGKRFLVYMKSKDGRYLRYSNAQHLRKTKRIKYRTIVTKCPLLKWSGYNCVIHNIIAMRYWI
jgi:hypothetical protein